VCASIPTHPSPFWLWIAAMIKSWLQTIYSSTTYWEIGFWMHNGIFCLSLYLLRYVIFDCWKKYFHSLISKKCLHWFCVFIIEKHAFLNFSKFFQNKWYFFSIKKCKIYYCGVIILHGHLVQKDVKIFEKNWPPAPNGPQIKCANPFW